MTDFVKAKRTIVSNLYDKETMHSEAHNWWIFSKNKAVIQKLDDRYEYWAFDIPVKENQDYTIWYNLGTNYWCQVYNIIAVDDEYHVVEKIVTNNFTIIEHINHITDEEAEAKNLPIIRSFRVPEHATRLLISLNSEKLLDELCLNEGIGKSLPYEPYQGTPKIKVEYTYSGLEDVVHGSSLMKFQLPESINILPGRWAGDKGRAASYVDLFYNESVIGNPINSNLYKTHVKDGVYCYSYAKYCNLSGYTLGHNVLTLDMYDEHLNKIVTE